MLASLVASVESGAGGGVRPPCNRAAVKRIHPSGGAAAQEEVGSVSGVAFWQRGQRLLSAQRSGVACLCQKFTFNPVRKSGKSIHRAVEFRLTGSSPSCCRHCFCFPTYRREESHSFTLNPNTALLLLFLFDSFPLFVLVRCTFLSAAAV